MPILCRFALANGSKSKVKSGKNAKKYVQVVPDAVAVINSKQDVCNYHDDMLCGCAVAWKLSCALLSKLREESNAQQVESHKVHKVKSGYEK